MTKKISRREFIAQSSMFAATAAYAGATPLISRIEAPYLKNPKVARRVIVLGMDGLDPGLVRRFVKSGDMPNFKKLIELGHFSNLQTTLPPQSPVAWSSFISGTNPGGNGIYDFIHRDPKTFSPHLSTTRSFNSDNSLSIGEWKIPLSSGKIDSMRRGPTLWSALEKQGIPSTLFQIPANFPVTTETTKALSGMGTPDLLGTYGTFTLFSETDLEMGDDINGGGRVVKIYPYNHTTITSIEGPPNSFKKDQENPRVEITINRDPRDEVVRIKVQNHDVILKKGEWSEWVPLSFEFVPMFATVSGIVRFYVQSVHPHLKVYCSPINVDPMDPSLPICSPSSYSKELSDAVGRFYTQGFPADTKALSLGVLSDDEYFAQAKLVISENMKALDWQFNNFNEGFFFFYFSSIDQNCHMMLRLMDPTHPLYNPDASEDVKNGVRWFYQRMDDALAKMWDKIDSYTNLFVISDHGFSSFKREFNLSTWLVKNGFTKLTDPTKIGQGDFYQYVDWENSKAYALGLNGIYLNLEGREKFGSLNPKDAGAVKNELLAKLPGIKDPKNNASVVHRAYDATIAYKGPFVPLAPDVLVGYNRGYRISDQAVLGQFPEEIVADRTDPWASDHCMDPSLVPGVLLSNREVKHPNPGLWDMAPTIIKSFGLTPPEEMEGENILA